MTDDPYQAARAAAGVLRERTGADTHTAAVVLGSGWSGAADAFGPPSDELAATDLPGFAAPAAGGHAGRIRSVPAGRHRLLIFLGRTHLYEGRGPQAAVHSIRTAAAAGARTVVLTNAAGAIRAEFSIGQPVLISDHLNLTGRSPLTGPRFVDLTHLYTPRLRALARQQDPALAEGVYACFPGPHYETPAEIRMARTLGADLVGMSTVLEAIAAREAGLDVLALSLVTNMAAGLSGEPLDHAAVLAAGQAAAVRIGALLARVLADVA
ncbi:MAG TPA: purine-nucleoside phosphorylase [Streptosporangiaceae bacterium]|nr:purine-nucleoside phosphorylase [Streptosporangiaceae bacterium]